MNARKFLTTRRRVAGSCWTLFAVALLTSPGLAWGQDCNDSGSLVKTPGGVYSLGQTVKVKYEFGSDSDTTDGLVLTVNNAEVRVALDCVTALSGTNREDCLGFNGPGDAAALDDGDAIAYAGGLNFGNVAGDACDGLVFSLPANGTGDPAEPDPNVLIFQADGPIQLDPGDSCFVEFDAHINGIGLPANWETPGNQFINAASGFQGSCTTNLGASSSKSTSYEVQITPAIDLRKEVSIDGGTTWFDANVEPFPKGFVPSTTALYQLIVENVGEEPLANVTITDDSPPLNLGLVDVPLPDGCLVDGFFPVGVPCIIDSGDSGFGGLGNPPVAVCSTSGVKTNLACTDGEGAASGEPVQACDPANVLCVEPALRVEKTGPTQSKVGETVTYTVCAQNTGNVDLENCEGTDDVVTTWLGDFGSLLIGAPEVCIDYDYVIPVGAPDEIENIATVECDLVGSDDMIDEDDNHIVNLFQPAISATKTGPDFGKVGDTFDYEICITNDSSEDTPALVNCEADDSLLGTFSIPAPAFGATSCVFQEYTIPADAPDVVRNDVDVTCGVTGFPNVLPADAFWEFDLVKVGAVLTKSCAPDTTIMVPAPISWEICVENTGNTPVLCTINDVTAGITDVDVTVPGGGTDCTTTNSRPTTSADVPTVTNTATAVCMATDYDNDAPTDPAEATCTVDEPGEEICRTPGFWGTHAGEEKAGRSTNLTQEVINYNGGSLGLICGREITNTNFDDVGDAPSEFNSALEAICVHPKGTQLRQLARQLTAAALNCVMSGGGTNGGGEMCQGISIYEDFTAANAACAAGEVGDWIGIIDDFNNGVDSDCHDRNLQESDVFDDVDYKVPGPAGSPRSCNSAIANDTYIIPVP